MLRHAALLLLSIPLLASAFPQTFPEAPGGPNFNPAASETVFLPVEEAYQLALEVTEQEQIRMFWQIADGYYLYRKRFAFELDDGSGPITVQTDLPTGLMHEDEYFGRTEIYRHSVDVILNPAPVSGDSVLTITSQGCADAGLCYPPQKQKYRVDLLNKTIAPILRAPRQKPTPGADPTSAGSSLNSILLMVLLAFAGGGILNLMPCVFPVLSLKVFSLATGSERTKHRHGWIYSAGVVSSFLLVAGLLISLQRAGSAVGWGFQLQSPQFVALLAYLFFAMGLSLSGVVELGAGMMGLGGNLADRDSYAGSFFTGVLATVVASPCTAPFMGTALGFAVTQPAPTALLIFAALGAGMAAPMLVLSYSRRLRNMMPRPGPWMETFKQALAFPLYATAIWLLWVAGRQTSTSAMALLLCGMLALALGLWLWRYRTWGKLMAGLAVLTALLLVGSPMLGVEAGNKSGTDGSAFSGQRLQQLLNQGNPVFVNVTADWCITCLVNEESTLGTDVVKAALADKSVVYLTADWTHYNPDIAEFLAGFNRNGIPLYLVYSGSGDRKPDILPQILTPGIVLDALQKL